MTDLARHVIIDQLREGAPVRWTVRGGSMWPTVRDGATVSATPVDPRTLRAGELVAYTRGDALVVHRVVAVRPEGLRCRGDALALEDGVVPWAHVLGRATLVRQRSLTLRWPRASELSVLLRAALGRVRAVLA